MKYQICLVLIGSLAPVFAVAADVREPVIPPIDRRPFSALETRPLSERPVMETPTLQQKTEAALDRELGRGNGRITDEQTHQVEEIRRDQLGADGVLPVRTAADRFRDDRERNEQIEAQRLKASREEVRAKRIEREDEALAKERADWLRITQRQDAAGGAVVDRMALDAVEKQYHGAIDAAIRARDAAMSAAGNDRAARTAAQQRYEAAKAAAIEARSAQREVILGIKK